MREEKRERVRELQLLSTIYRDQLVGIRQAKNEVHLLVQGYAWVPKTRDFAKDLRKEFGKSKVLGLRSVNGTS